MNYSGAKEYFFSQIQEMLMEAGACRVGAGDYSIPPITQTLEDLSAEYSDPGKALIILKIVKDRRIVGSVRSHEMDGTCYIGRLMVHPDYQRKGFGRLLMQAIEACFRDTRYELFAGSKSTDNIRLYESLGYKIFKTEDLFGVYSPDLSGKVTNQKRSAADSVLKAFVCL